MQNIVLINLFHKKYNRNYKIISPYGQLICVTKQYQFYTYITVF